MSLVGPRFLWLLTCLVLAAGLVTSAGAQIVESREWLVKKTEHALLDEFKTNFGWPDPELPKGQAVLYVQVKGWSFRVLAVGPKTSDAKRYAQKLDAWRRRNGLSGTVEYSQESDCAAASFIYSVAGFGKTELNFSIPLASLYRDVRLEDTTRFGVVMSGVAQLPSDFDKPNLTKQSGYRYWDFSDWRAPKDVRLSARLDWWAVPAFVALALFPFLCAAVTYCVAVRIARDPKLPLNTRQERFKKIQNSAVLWTGGPSLILGLAVVFSRVLARQSEFLFGDFRTPMSLLFVIGAVVAFPVTGLFRKEHLKLAEQSLDQLGRPPLIKTPRVEESGNREFIWEAFQVPFAIACALSIHYLPTTKTDAIHQYKSLIAMLVSTLIIFLSPRWFSVLRPAPTTEEVEIEPELRQKIQEVLGSLKANGSTGVNDVKIHPQSPLSITIYVTKNKLGISDAAIRELTPDELEFCILESERHPEMPMPTIPQTVVASLLPFLTVIYWALAPAPSVLVATIMTAVLLIPTGFWLTTSFRAIHWMREEKLRIDLELIRLTGNPSAAVSAFQKQDNFLRADPATSGSNPKPTYSERIARIRAAFPETPSDPASE
ncbi:hypothetical protein MCEMSE15_02590 [Fimbriimonadaceae bacterium]